MLSPGRWLIVLAFALSAFVLFARLGEPPLIAPDEGRNAEVAREMYRSGAWLVPTYDGLVYLDKPAFYFKAVALSFRMLGETQLAARLPSALFGFALLIAVFLFCRHVYDEPTAATAVLTVATAPLYIAFSRAVIFDMTLAFFVCSAVFACYLAEEADGSARRRWYLAGALASGVATLVKGPVGFIVPTLVVAIFNRLEGRKGAMRRFFALRNWAVFLAVVLPWFVGLSILRPDFPYYGIVEESLARFATSEFHRTAPFYFFAVVVAGGSLAWSLLFPESMVAAWRSRTRLSRADRLFVVWAVVVVVFFSLSQSKLPGYILTAIIALGVLTGRLFAAAFRDARRTAGAIVLRGTVALLLLSAVAGALLGIVVLDPGALGASFLARHPAQDPYMPGLPLVALSLAGVAILAALGRWLSSPRIAFVAFLSLPLLFISVNFDLLTTYAHRHSSRRLAESIPGTLPPDTEIACLRCLPNGLPFYLRRLVTVVSERGLELTSNYVLFTLKAARPWPKGIVPVAQLDRWLAGRRHPIYLLAGEAHLPRLRSIAAKYDAKVDELGSGYWAALIPHPGKS
jgi:4-amino-4-deoxy-L-arabinose transferase-like glycosyltransferase